MGRCCLHLEYSICLLKSNTGVSKITWSILERKQVVSEEEDAGNREGILVGGQTRYQGHLTNVATQEKWFRVYPANTWWPLAICMVGRDTSECLRGRCPWQQEGTEGADRGQRGGHSENPEKEC